VIGQERNLDREPTLPDAAPALDLTLVRQDAYSPRPHAPKARLQLRIKAKVFCNVKTHLRAAIAAAVAGLVGFALPALAQRVAIPNFWDPRATQERPDVPTTRTVRVLTDDEFPPMHFAGPDGVPTGFSVELARAVCERLGLACTVQARRFDTLLDALAEGRGDVVAAAIPASTGLRQRFTATRPYFRTPGRFAVRREGSLPEPDPKALDGRPVAVVAGTAHEAYLKTFFPGVAAKPVPDLAAAGGPARRRGRVPVRRRPRARGLDRWPRVRRLLRLRGRPVPREPVLRRGHRLRPPPGRRQPPPRLRLRPPAPARRGEVRGAVPEVLPGRGVLTARFVDPSPAHP
jgi:ABC-type amino acid transport substrate-binding protein